MTASANRPSQLGRTSMLDSAALLFLQILAIVVADPTGTQCNQPEGRYETCVCQASQDGVVDLTGLANDDGGSARFTDLQDNNQFYYSYNPCTSFYSDTCYNQVYSCQQSEDGSQIFSIANDGTEQMWIDDDGSIYLYYTGDEGREMRVNLHCDMTVKDPMISTDGDSAVPLTYVFDVTGCDVCYGGCESGSGRGSGGSEGGGSGGEGGGGGRGGMRGGKWKRGVEFGALVVVITIAILITGVIMYFVAGALIMKFHYKVTGMDNKKPKVWSALPVYLKEFLFRAPGPSYQPVPQCT